MNSWELSLPLDEFTGRHGLGIEVGGKFIHRLRSERSLSSKNKEESFAESLFQLDARSVRTRETITVVLDVTQVRPMLETSYGCPINVFSYVLYSHKTGEDTLESSVTPAK